MNTQEPVATYRDRIESARSVVQLPTPEQREVLSAVDSDVSNVFQATALRDLVGVIAGVKPTAIILSSEIDRAKVDAMGLSTVDIWKGVYGVSQTELLADDLVDAFEMRSNPNANADSHRKVGELLGYPDSSIDYFNARVESLYTPEELPAIVPRSTEDTIDEYFHDIILSPEGYKQEIEAYAEPLKAAMRELAPNAYALFERKIRMQRVSNKMRKGLSRLLRKDYVKSVDLSGNPIVNKYVD